MKKLSHRRYNPLTGEWVLNSPNRIKRPWLGEQKKITIPKQEEYDPECYLCPNNQRAQNATNPDYKGCYVFANDFPAFSQKNLAKAKNSSDVFFGKSEVVSGENRVICYSHRHDKNLDDLSSQEIAAVIELWQEQIAELGKKYRWVQIFENKGEMMGCSNPHPHCQVWASDFIPTKIEKEHNQQRAYFQKTKKKLLLDYIAFEKKSGERIVFENTDWIALVPYWAVWPFELLLCPNFDCSSLLNVQNRLNLAKILRQITTNYNKLFSCPFPYSMGWHGLSSTSPAEKEFWQLHCHFYPPLLRSATIKKFMVGYEMLAESQRDLTPEEAAARLRAV
jgi:UDPglucose--hexose-1-phosphate uridylyltransferase